MNFTEWASKIRGLRQANGASSYLKSTLATALAATMAVATIAPATATAAPLGTMSLEGQLLTTGGTPVPDGTYTVTVSFYKAKSDVQALFSQVVPVKTVSGGFILTLGLKTLLPKKNFYSGDAAWIGITVDSDPELTRIPINHIAYAMRADVASKLQCSGCVSTDQLDSKVLAPYAKIADLKFALSGQKCGKGMAVAGIDAAGKVVCAKDADTTYDGKNFALSGQSCAKGMVVAGLDAGGKVKCVKDLDTDTKYSGKNFALSAQSCPAGQVVTGFGADGKAKCAPDQKGQSSGKDFALSNQACVSGMVMKGVDKDGKAVCVKDSAPTGPADKFTSAQVTNLQANKLANGAMPWNTTKYDVNNEWLRERGDDAHFKQYGGKRQMVFRTDGVAQYNSGIGNYPFVFQYGGDVKANSVMAINGAGQLWLKAYGWLHTAFAKAGKTCKSGYVVRGFTSGGDPICVLDQKGQSSGKDFALSNQSCGSGMVARAIDSSGKLVCIADKDTTYKAGTGIVISGTTISGNFSFLDSRFVNENQANSISGAMIKNSTITGADVADSSLTGSDIKNGSITGSDVAGSTLTGGHIADSSLTGADIKNSTLTGADIADGSVTGSDIANGSVTGTDIASETITSADVKNGSLTYSDTNVNSIQRRVASSCAAGQAIRAINSNGTVVCEAEVGAQGKTYSGKAVNGNWYRIATTKGGAEVAATFTVWDTTYENNVQFRVGISSGYEGGMSFNLLGSSRYTGKFLDKVRIGEGSSGSIHFIDIRASANAQMYVKVDDNDHQDAWIVQNPTSVGTSNSVSGYNVRIFELDRLMNVGDYTSRLEMTRGGVMGIGTPANGSYRLSVGGNSRTTGSAQIDKSLTVNSTANMKSTLTVGSTLYANNGVVVDGKTVIDNGANWHRAYNKSGFINVTYGGGIYMQDTSWVRIYNNKGLYTAGEMQAGYLHSTGNTQVDKSLTVNGTANMKSTLTVANTLYANNGVVVDGKQVIDNGATWHRAHGASGFINHTYGGGIYMKDTSWLRIYGDKGVVTAGTMQAGYLRSTGNAQVDKNLTVNGTAAVASTLYANNGIVVDGQTVIDNGAGWHRSYGATGWYNGSYGGGIYMKDSSWVRTYGNKSFMVDNGNMLVDSVNSQFYVIPDGNGRVEFRSKKGGSPYIDFSNDTSVDYDMRVMLTGNNDLTITGGNTRVDNLYVGSKQIWTYIRDLINSNCYLYVGWRDSCSGCGSIYKSARINGNGSYATSYVGGTRYYKGTVAGHGNVSLVGYDTDGDVNDDDKFWFGFKCY